jgi:LysM repeat protein
MYDEESRDDSGFWDDMPTSRLEKLTAMRHAHAERNGPGRTTRATRAAGAVKAERSPRLRRTGSVGPVGSRHHDDTGSVPVVPGTGAITDRVRAVTDHVDPLLRRMGVVAILVDLAVPVAMAARRDDTAAAPLQPDTSESVDAASAAPLDPVVTDAPLSSEAGGQATTHTSAKRASSSKMVAAATTTDATTTSTIALSDVAMMQAQKAAQVTRASCKARYSVVRGDGWYVVARKTGVSVHDLLALNGATLSTALYPGRILCLPAKAATTTTAKAPTTTVKKPTTTTVKAPTTTAKKPTTTTTKPVTVTPKTYTRAEIIQIIRDVWPDNLEDKAIAIATRESNLVPTAHNPICYGLFQIYFNVHKSWLATIGVTSPTQLYDPRVNAYAALVMYMRAGGWGPWS